MYRIGGLLILSVGVLSGCTTSEVLVAHAIDLVEAPATLPEEQLLDVGIVVFDPGVPDGDIDRETLEQLRDDGTFVHIRRAESVYLAVRLRDTLQRSGHWGSVWVTPESSMAADLRVSARIVHSDGDLVRVDVTAADATGRTWVDKPYELEAPAGAYNRQRYPNLDPYQDLFDSVANDLAAVRARMPAPEARRIRTVGALRYAGDLNPAAFEGYLAASRGGIYEPVRLPAADDPMLRRTQLVRQRERLLFETLNGHYDHFAAEVTRSYGSWREAAREESVAIRELTRSMRWRKALGIAATVASIASMMHGGDYNSLSSRMARDGLMLMGTGMLEMSAVHSQGRRLHAEALEELSESFDDEAEPLVVEVAGIQHRLAGTAEVQYAEWRALLRQLFIEETGSAPGDIEIYPEAAGRVYPDAGRVYPDAGLPPYRPGR